MQLVEQGKVNLGLGVVVMANVDGYQSYQIAEGLVSAWRHEK